MHSACPNNETMQLRPISEQDIASVLDIYREPTKYLPQIPSREEAQQLVALAQQLRENRVGDMLAVIHEDAVIGIAHLYDGDRAVDKAFIRIDLLDPQNSMQRCDALNLFIPYVFDDGWRCVYYAIFDSCTGELAMDLKHLEFVHDVTLRGYYKTGSNQYTDVHWFSLLVTNWQGERSELE